MGKRARCEVCGKSDMTMWEGRRGEYHCARCEFTGLRRTVFGY